MRDLDFFLKQYAPVTTQMAFFEMPAIDFAEALFLRTEEITKMWELPWQVKKRAVHGGLHGKLQALLPLTSVRGSKTLVSETQSNWSAYIPNGHRGGDVHAEPTYLAGKLGIRTLTVVLVEDVPQGQPGSIQFIFRDGRNAVEVKTRYGTMYESTTRSISVHKEGRWEFSQHGNPLPFEEIENYDAKKIKDRLTLEMIERYCDQLGIKLFDPTFYAGDGFVIDSYPPPNTTYYSEYPNQLTESTIHSPTSGIGQKRSFNNR